VDIFGHTSIPKIISLGYTGTQFEIYNKISRNYDYSFLFESLTGPEELAETSIMGFDPEYIVKGYYDKVIIKSRNGILKTISTDEPLTVIKDLVQKTDDQTYRYLGGAVGIINYDAIRLWEKIPKNHSTAEPIMEFGIYNDGILFDNKQKKSLYFYYTKNRVDEIKTTKSKFDSFTLSEITTNLNDDEFYEIVEKAKKYIYDGDIFQVVLSRKFSFEASGDYLKVYQKLRSLNPSPYLYHLKMNKKTVIGSSPEMLLRVTNDYVETFPIAGTRKISNDQLKNEQLRQELISDENPYGLNPEDPNSKDDILVMDADLHLKINQPVKVELRSLDVLHNFYIPQFRAKMDMLPGIITYYWFTPEKKGDFEILCAEYCGTNHYAMRGRVLVDEDKDYSNWLAKQITYEKMLTKKSVEKKLLVAENKN